MQNMDLLLVSVGVFLCVGSLLAVSGAALMHRRDPLRRRLMEGTSPAPGAGRESKGWLQSTVESALRAFGITNWNAPGVRSIGQRLALFVVILLAGFGACGALITGFVALRFPGILALPAGIIAGWLTASTVARFWMRWHQRKWMEEINNNIIDVIDLWVLCLGAGMSFASALVRVSQDEELTSSALREELQLTNQEMLAGCPREDALRHLVRRCGDTADLRALVTHIIQSERLGSSLTDTLRVYAQSLRFKRTQDAKELIQTLPVKLTFPLVFCILPALFVIILGPSVIRLFEVLTGK